MFVVRLEDRELLSQDIEVQIFGLNELCHPLFPA